jgi:hypothetical protein
MFLIREIIENNDQMTQTMVPIFINLKRLKSLVKIHETAKIMTAITEQMTNAAKAPSIILMGNANWSDVG